MFATVPMRYLQALANAFAKAPVGYITSRAGPVVLVVGATSFVALARWLRTGRRPPRGLVVTAAAALPILVWTTAAGVGPPASLTVRFFDVGQGDSALVTSPAGATVLVDGGPDDDQVATELAALGVKRLDVVVASHPHADHVIGLPNVLSSGAGRSAAPARMSGRRRRFRPSWTGRSTMRGSTSKPLRRRHHRRR